eukprot:TRINITY_DN115069_c0_g1_i1.p1 TRINITY_DN115069_c0_g1~~TRINITY_DN115069_c0_g1_i1.p1  ORF type:complete len:345 (+),score=63.09 TRINITY_DN115069_c0_g1_i1:26-1036(+)
MAGCVLEIPDIITGITLVALGTSMPDLFASKTAAVQDPTSDASIVNVTGSNSVNVFLGLGIPWTIGSVVWKMRGPTDEWKARSNGVSERAEWKNDAALVINGASEFGFGVTIFVITSFIAIFVLMFRRWRVGGELGGALPFKICSGLTFLSLWFTYVGLTSWKAIRGNKADDEERNIVFMMVGGVVGFLLLCTLATGMCASPPVAAPEEKKLESSKDDSDKALEEDDWGDEALPVGELIPSTVVPMKDDDDGYGNRLNPQAVYSMQDAARSEDFNKVPPFSNIGMRLEQPGPLWTPGPNMSGSGLGSAIATACPSVNQQVGCIDEEGQFTFTISSC